MDIFPPSRDPRGRFPKGQSGHPSGRPVLPQEGRQALECGSVAAAERLVQLVNSEDPRIALAASEALLSRLYGKPSQMLDATVRGGVDVGQAHLQALLAIQQRRQERLAAEAKTVGE